MLTAPTINKLKSKHGTLSCGMPPR